MAWLLLLLVAGGLGTFWLERRLLAPAAEPGPAAPIPLRTGRRPVRRDAWLYGAAPVVAVTGAALGLVVLPWDRGLIGQDLGIGLFYFIVVVDLVVLGVAMGGWGANAAGGVEACYRIVAQLVAYVIPLGLAIIGPIMMARSLSTMEIVRAQEAAGVWYVLVQPLGFLLYVATGLMQTYRAPFLEPFADRIGRGVLGLYGGWQGAAWQLALGVLLFGVAAMGAVLFLGGPSGPLLPGWIWMVCKTAAMVALMVLVGRRARLTSTARMLGLSWKILIPAGLLNVLIVGALILWGVGQTPFRQ